MTKKLVWPRINKKGELVIPPTGIPGFRLFIRRVHIDTGIRHSSASCMEALALRDIGATSINVTSEYLRFNLPKFGIRLNYLHPSKGPMKLKVWDEEESAKRAARSRGRDFVSKVPPFSLMLRGATATCAPILKRGPLLTPRAKHPTRGKKLKLGARRSIRRYHGVRVITVPKIKKSKRG